MADIKQIQVGGTNYNISGAAIVLEDNGTTTNGVFKAKTSQITSLVDGQMFLYRLPKNFSLYNNKLTITANGNVLSQKSIYSPGFFEENEIILLVYSSFTNSFAVINYSRYTGTKARLSWDSNGKISLYDENDARSFAITEDEFFVKTNSSTRYGKFTVGFDPYNPYIKLSGDQSYGEIQISCKGLTNNGTKVFYWDDDGKFYINDGECGIHIMGGMDIKSSKIFSGDVLVLATGNDDTSTRHRIELDSSNNQTKIYLEYDNQHSHHTQMKLTSDGLKLNRPIYLTDDEDPEDAKLNLKYNKTDDSLDIIFE